MESEYLALGQWNLIQPKELRFHENNKNIVTRLGVKYVVYCHKIRKVYVIFRGAPSKDTITSEVDCVRWWCHSWVEDPAGFLSTINKVSLKKDITSRSSCLNDGQLRKCIKNVISF